MAYDIAPPQYTKHVTYKNGSTRDIIKEVLDANSEKPVLRQTAAFSKQFTRDYDGMRDLWHWVKENIHYVEDPDGVQWIREPARLWADKQGDCKSFTLFMCSVFFNLGIPYTIRFVTYSKFSKVVTHVYPICHIDGRDIIMDAVWTAFDSHKTPFYLKKDYSFMEISRLAGIGAAENTLQQLKAVDAHMKKAAHGLTSKNDGVDITTLTEAEAIAYLTGGAVSGIGSSLPAFTLPTIVISGADGVEGIGSWLSQAGDWVKKQATSVVNDIKNTVASVINWVFKGPLKAAGPFFLFAFIQRSVSAEVDKRRVKQQKIISFIAGVTGTSEAVCMASLADGIKTASGKTPQQALNAAANGEKVQGIGIAPAIVMAVIEIITKLVDFFKKKDAPKVSENDASDPALLAAQADNAPVASENTGIIPSNVPRNADKQQTETPRDSNPTPQNGGGGLLPPRTATANEPAKDNSMLMWGGAALVGFYLLSQNKGVGYVTDSLNNQSMAKCRNKRFSTSARPGGCSHNGGILYKRK